MNNEVLVDIVGWIGAIALLVAYALISARRVEGDSTSYQSLNLVGSILLIVNTVYYRAYPSAFLNLVWGAIAVYAIGKVLPKLLQGKR
jgi:phosphoglycerol transferase MdoB-like AlkP superfamily enzyme